MVELFKQGHDKIKRWSFSGDFGRDFEELFNLQMWCLGLDIRREAGNLALNYGFIRHKLPDAAYGSSQYILTVAPETALHLVGFAAMLEDSGSGIIVKRYQRSPFFFRENLAPGMHTPHKLPTSFTPRTENDLASACYLLKQLALELRHYESYIHSSTNLCYQKKRVLSAPRRSRRLKDVNLQEAWGALYSLI
jgi:hypothetical protein